MITGVHAIIFNQDADGVRAFFRDTLGFSSVDAGHGWLIFALPPAELGIHPTDGPGNHELYLMCDDIQKTVEELQAKGVEFLNKSTPFEQVGTIFVMALAVARTDGELRRTGARTRSPQRGPGIFAVLAQGIELQIDLCQAIHIVIEITYHALQGIQGRFFR